MDEFNTDEPLVDGSGINNPTDPPKKDKKPSSTKGIDLSPVDLTLSDGVGIKVPQHTIPQLETSSRSLDLGFGKEKFDSKFRTSFISDDLPKRLAEYQSNWDRAGNLVMRMGTNVLGGMVSAVGSPHAIGEGIIDELNNKDADFRNVLTDFGDEMKEWAKVNFPNYRKNPGASWDFDDPAAWFFGGVESIASTLEFLLPTYGFVKGLGAVNKLVQAEKVLAKLGANAQKLKVATKIAAGAAFQRNAENIMESSQLVKQKKEELLAEFQNPERFEEMKNSEVGKELAAEGREVTPESLSTFIAGKAGWEAYKINSWNIGFDALQIAPLMKGFNPSTRLGGLRTPAAVKAANRKAISSTAKDVTTREKIFDITNPFLSTLGRSATEGLEEIVNYQGTLQGENLTARLTGKEEKETDIGQMTEAGFWGMLGGLVFEGASKLINKGKSNTETNLRLGEIANRALVLKEASNRIDEINKSELPDEQKKEHINGVKAELALDLGMRAAQTGNVDLLLDQIGSKEFSDRLVEMGVADIKDVDRAIAKTKEDVLLAEKLYKEYYNTFQNLEGSDVAKAALLNKSIVADFFVHKNVEKRNKVTKELEELKAKDPYLKNNKSPNLETLIELEGLLTARRGINKVIRRSDKQQDALLSGRGKAELENINKRIVEIKEQVKGERIDKNEINPQILSKQAEIILMDSVNNVQRGKIKDNTTTQGVKKEESTINDNVEKKINEAIQLMKTEVDSKSTVEELRELRAEIEETGSIIGVPDERVKEVIEKDLAYIDEKIRKLENEKQVKQKKANVEKETKEAEAIPVTESGEFAGLPEYPAEEYDVNGIDPTFQQDIDRLIENKQYSELAGYIDESFKEVKTGPYKGKDTVGYARTKLAEARAKANVAQQVKELNSDPPKGNLVGEFDEFEDHEPRGKGLTLEKLTGQSQDTYTLSEEDTKAIKWVNSLIARQQNDPSFFHDSRFVRVKELYNKGILLREEKEGDAAGRIQRTYYLNEEYKGEEINEEPIFKFLHPDSIGKPTVTASVPLFRPFGREGKGHQEFFQAKNGNILIRDEWVETVKTLFDPEFKAGVEVTIEWDKNNKYTKKRGDKNEEAFVIKYKGVPVAYLGTVSGVKNAIAALERKKKQDQADAIKLDLAQIEKLRNKLELVEGKVWKTKLAYKDNGTVVSRGTKQTALRSIKGISEKLYAVSSKSVNDTKALTNLEDENERIRSISDLKPGRVYIGLPNSKGEIIPVPLIVSKVNTIQAKEIAGNVEKLLNLLNEGKNTEHKEVIALKDAIAKYIRVDRRDNYDKPVGFRVHTQYTKEDGTIGAARIEIAYTNLQGEKKIAVLKKSQFTGELWMGLFKGNEKTYEITSGQEGFEKGLIDLFRMKYHNIDFALLNKDKAKPFTYNGKTYKNYKEYLIEEEILKTDVAQVVDKNGNVLSNLFGFENDFKIEIESDVEVVGEKKEENTTQTQPAQEPTGLRDLFLVDTTTNRLQQEYEEKYELFKTGESDAVSILKEIEKNPTSGHVRTTVKWLLSNADKINVPVRIGMGKYKGGGAYVHSEHAILIKEERGTWNEDFFQYLFLHELVHAVTVGQILRSSWNTNTAVKSLFDPYKLSDIPVMPFKASTPDYIKNFVIQMIELRDQAIGELTTRYGKSAKELAQENSGVFYGLTDVFEFISEVMTNPDFQREIATLKGRKGILQRIWNAVVEIINKFFGTNISIDEEDILKTAVNTIKDVVNRTEYKGFTDDEVHIADIFPRLVQQFDNHFTREEILEVVSTMKGFIANAVRRGKIDVQDGLEDRSNDFTVRENILSAWRSYRDTMCPEPYKAKVQTIIDYFDKFYDKAISRINREFKVGTAYDIDLLKENEGLTKNWDDTKAQQISSQDTVTNQIKLFMNTVPELDNLDHKLDEKGNPIWNRKKSSVTGIARYTDFNVVYPYMIRNLVGARTRAEIISRLNNMSKVNPSFAFVAHELSKDENLLAQFESNLAKKTVYDSYVTFITNLDDTREIWIKDELKSSRYDVSIADDWKLAIDNKIDQLQTEEDIKSFRTLAKVYVDLINTRLSKFSENKEAVRDAIFKFASSMGVDISIASVESVINSARTEDDIRTTLVEPLDLISGSILRKKKGFDFKRLNNLAKIEALYRFDVIENSGLDIKGNLIYAIRNPSFISNWFNEMKNISTPEAREMRDNVLSAMAKVPELQMSTLLWNKIIKKPDGTVDNERSQPGFLNYEIVDNIKIPKYKTDDKGNKILDVNEKFLQTIAFHDYGGAKETLSRMAQKYSEFTDNDWKLMNLISYLNLNDKREREKTELEKRTVLIPSIIASDSGKAGYFEFLKVVLRSQDVYRSGGRLKVKQDSELFKAVMKVTTGEIRRMQQVTQQLFDIVDNKLVVKKGLKIDDLQQYCHYNKPVYNEDDTINIEKTLLNPNGSPTGKAFYFHNMSILEGDKITTLDDIEGIKINHHIPPGTLDKVTVGKIIQFTDRFISQQIEKGLKDYSALKEEVSGKYSNIVDGTFEGLIAEYVLNHYIFNNEQFLMFNGTMAEYKSKTDTNKRAKQLFTPGVGLSEEAMKITYENGSQSDGATFKAITLRDITTTSHTIDFIVETVKNGLLSQRKYSKKDEKGFSLSEVKKKTAEKSSNKLIKDVHKIIKGYLAINAGDAQGYITLDRLESIIRGRGEWNDSIAKTISRARRGETMSSEDITEMLKFTGQTSLQPVKGFYFGNEYDAVNNKMTATQIKYSTVPLIPSMVKGTELEKLMNFMNRKAIDEAFFESAHKVGAKNIVRVDNTDGTINEEALEKSVVNTYFNKNYKIQLDTPEHLLDEENLLAKQISKLIIANINLKGEYNVGGRKYTGEQLIERYFQVWTENIEESSIDLLKELSIEVTDTGYIVKDEKIQKILQEEVGKRGLSDNYLFAIELDDRGPNGEKQFKLPLFVNNMATKWEAILTSLFTNNIVKQKAPGGSVVLASRLFLDKATTIKGIAIEDVWKKIERGNPVSFGTKDGLYDLIYFKDNGKDRYFSLSEGQDLTERSKEFFEKEINAKREREEWDFEVHTPSETRELLEMYSKIAEMELEDTKEFLEKITENITVEKENGIKWSKTKEGDHTLRSTRKEGGKVLEVEVLLGAWSKNLYKNGQLIDIDEVPDEIKTMIGYRIPTTSKSYMTVFKVVGFLPEEAKGVIVTPDDMVTQMGQDFDIDKWFLMNKEFIRTKKGRFVIPKYGTKEEFEALQEDVEELTKDSLMTPDEASVKLADSVAKYMKLPTREELLSELEEKRELLKQFGKYNEDGTFEFNPKAESRAARNNEIFDIYKAILTNPAHLKEVFTPSGYPNITEVSERIADIFGEQDENINPLTESGQREFRKRNLTGKDLLGISANFNGFMALAQVSKMYLNKNISYKFKFSLEDRNLKELKKRYGKDLTVTSDKKHAIITLSKLGYAPDGSYLNVDGDLIMEVASEGVVAAADNAKDPRLEKLNLSTYTYPAYHAGVSVGVPVREMGFFIRQPIIKALNEFYFDNKSILSDETGRQIETVKRLYQTHLYNELLRQDPQHVNKVIKRINDHIAEIRTNIETLKNDTSVSAKRESLKLNKELGRAIKKLEEIRKTLKNTEKRRELRKKNNAPINYDSKYLLYVKREHTKDILEYDPSNLDVFSAEELEEQMEMRAKGFENLSPSDRLKYLKTQLQVIEYFNRWKKAGEGISDMAKVSKTDGLGAGPSMDITSELIRTVESLEDNTRVLIDNEIMEGQPAITRLYPAHFGLGNKSVYLPIETYFDRGNKLSRDILSKLFISQTKPFRDVVYTVAGQIKGDERRTLNENEVKAINKFLNVTLLAGFSDFAIVDKAQVLGVSKTPITLDKLPSIEEFRELSVAEKVAVMQKVYQDRLLTQPQHILNFLTPILDSEIVKTKGYHELAFTFYKNEFTDDNLADSISTMYETGNEFEQDLAISLVNYSFVAHGLTFGLKSFAKVIPTELLYNRGLGEYLREMRQKFEEGLTGFSAQTVDRFFRNNWSNSDFVPVVRTRWDYVINPQTGRKQIRRDENGNKFTKDRSPIWDAEQSILIIDHRAMETLPSKAQVAPYLSVWTKDGLKLYKKFVKIINTENSETRLDRFPVKRSDGSTTSNIYYYRVGKLGKDGILEMTDESVFPENNVEEREDKLVNQIENTITQLKKQNNAAGTNNITKQRKEEITKHCKIK